MKEILDYAGTVMDIRQRNWAAASMIIGIRTQIIVGTVIPRRPCILVIAI